MQLEYFQMVDAVEALDAAAGTVRCRATVPAQSTIFEGHFPGHPLMPGTLLIEAMAQSAGFLLLKRSDFERLPYLLQVARARLRTFVEPDTELTVSGTLEHDGSGFAVTKCEIRRGAEPIADAELRFRTMPFPTPDLRDMVRERAAQVGVPV